MYYRKYLTCMVLSFPLFRRVLHNYFVWEFAVSYLDALGRQFRDALFRMEKIKYGADAVSHRISFE